MRVYKETPFEFSLMTWEIEPRRPVAMVVVKGSFDLTTPRVAEVAAEQTLVHGPVAHDLGTDAPSLALASDYALTKTRAEWYLKGTLRPPRPETLVPVRVQVGALHKEMAVWGDRVWKGGVLGAAPTEPSPFEEMLLCWERAFGGPGVDLNPAGVGSRRVTLADGSVVEPVPNLQDPHRPMVSKDERPPPHGMFPLAPTWPTRVRSTGTYDQRWRDTRWPFFPEDFHPDYYSAAPADQRLPEGFFRGDEVLRVYGVSREDPRLTTALPGLRPRVFVQRRPPLGAPAGSDDAATAGQPVDIESLAGPLPSEEEILAEGIPRLEDVPLRLDTIVIDIDTMQAVCSWRGLVEVADHHLSDLRRLFLVHEPIGTERPLEDYGEMLRRALLEEHAELEGEEPSAPEPEAPQLAPPPAEEGGDPPADVMTPKAILDQGFAAGLQALTYIESHLEQNPTIRAREMRRLMIEAGLEPVEWLDEPKVEVPEDRTPRSLLRLAAIVRRKLGRGFVDEDLTDAPYRSLNLSGMDFSGAILTGADLEGADLTGCRFDGATATGASLRRSKLEATSMVDADFSSTDLRESILRGATLTDALLDEARLERAEASEADLTRASLAGARCERIVLVAAVLDEADFSGADLHWANFERASLLDTSFEGCRMVEVNMERVRAANVRAGSGADFTGSRMVLMDAPGGQFQSARLSRADLSGSNLKEADFSGAQGAEANFTRSVLRSAVFDFAQLPMALFLQSDLFEAQFQDADVRGADFRGAHLFSAALWRARLEGARLDGAIRERTLIEESE